ncbi:DUF3343 domain-containing protein [Gudongella oleilytica]|jgi:hypothetical protein|uniref:DUF3343 domain-containing protein n=1 Tax=Gudongella oleilytica TaxID=1582259 RepID=UPI000FF88C35|nr:DUF3343 domain-containing protein [Gudongella oleilytica]
MYSYLAIFFTHSGAIKFQRKLDKSGIKCKLLPVPRTLSSNCGIGASFESNDYEVFLDEEIEKIFRIEDEKFLLQYEVND